MCVGLSSLWSLLWTSQGLSDVWPLSSFPCTNPFIRSSRSYILSARSQFRCLQHPNNFPLFILCCCLQKWFLRKSCIFISFTSCNGVKLHIIRNQLSSFPVCPQYLKKCLTHGGCPVNGCYLFCWMNEGSSFKIPKVKVSTTYPSIPFLKVLLLCWIGV